MAPPSKSTYEPPKLGLLSLLPPSLLPLGELVRLDKIAAGINGFYLPFLFGSLYSACITQPRISVLQLTTTCGTLFIAVCFLHGWAVAYNDILDRDLDAKVERCRNRVLVRGAMTVQTAIIIVLVHLACCLAVFALLSQQCWPYTVVHIILHFSYPLSKRITDYTPFVLGLTFASGMFVGTAAFGIEPFTLWREDPKLAIGLGCLFASSVIWTLEFETIYAHQDVRDDEKAGIKSLAVRLKDRTKTIIGGLATLQVLLLTLVGQIIGAGLGFYAFACGGTTLSMGLILGNVRLEKPHECLKFFLITILTVGGSIALGLLSEYVRLSVSKL
ncbi:Para-hydroxybenzoate--polyprenyltransferase, mitochondrial precursor (PHB:polyprenyltransferase) [Agyrium rufum]|nr:Para-hydroxybenzoate--polyprenyltransferase, mitochondrial precursor (PHB:polyprenyltransferase) [Agyrium rufum]